MTQTIDFLSHLNSSQRLAVEHFCGPLLVVAGAGSGKTRALTYRIANLILQHRVDPENILAVTFTNKAAREMKERIEKLFAQQLSVSFTGKPWEALNPDEQTRVRSRIYKTYIKPLWVGTFHALCAKILRFDINKYKDEKGRSWNQNFSIFDESDAQSLVKQIVTQQLNLDDKKFNHKSVRYAISNAKNQGLSPQEFERSQPNYRGRTIAQVYSLYQDKLAENNALDFDDLILVPVQLFQQNEQILAYWHRKFCHILVDEYQDTNRTQYDLIRLLVTGGVESSAFKDWQNRSIFVVGDADQSIYSFRMADFTILMDFQGDFGDGLPDDDTRTMVKLEENYRSRENILQAANHLIEKNTERIDKVLKPTRDPGSPIYYYQAEDEQDEAEFVVQQIRQLQRNTEAENWGDFAILYRTNAQSRPLEEILVRSNIPYHVVGGLKFYDRKEVKDALAYLRSLVNPADTMSLLRTINTPRRGIGKATIDNLVNAASELGVPLWEMLADETSVQTLAGRSAKAVLKFTQLMSQFKDNWRDRKASEIAQAIMEESGYIQDLKSQGTDEAENRLQNVFELFNAILQFEEENLDATLEDFLASASLSSDLDNLQEGQESVSLMTLHSAKGLEFPVVFLVGLEQGLFPNFRSIDDPASLEEERRLCYVGITRAQEQLFLTHARSRRLWATREPAVSSQFLAELPTDLLSNSVPSKRFTTVPSAETAKAPGAKTRKRPSANTPQNWQVGDRVLHTTFGVGNVTHIFSSGTKMSIAVEFSGGGRKILDPAIAPLQRLT
ncbi:DNA helicase PcrA [Desertifilum sp. FACHB-1129]|uniref:ATP-dependent DNA helicase n=1 Tax=Desertifilum tharense IPPAS B-1220 TaxID=1781255 RepID=A0A1E5QLT2_9CYAN|nr:MULTISPECIES: DNA helicase PcrA [Desertifilum]MDA0212967.1 DNA helicase PcrA [Cyanobacteria bacterium FC1]MBD2312463.1 DNA helicase PcrA [Desertifilum sp. FACHB-1129]MBD2323405.1 DNA helicase PcrA [Desertifilum sp. FACHB-866]MBD2333250.1 DNA helicase PcrA [Desertifilum sp. FACHB-868]OEJ75636.1 ATP-dependent DNA helicase PcrA [Desertifilum tharense IPPAS B-1220]